MGTKNENENASNPVVFLGPQTRSESILLQRFVLAWFLQKTSLSLSVRGIHNSGWKCRRIFQNERVRFAKADNLELYFTSEAQTPTHV